MVNPTTKIAGKKRAHVPKQGLSGSIFASKYDYTDGNTISAMFRGIDTSYAIARDSINADLRYLGSPLCRLIGDEFCSATESQINLLADVSSLVGTGPLTNNNGVTFVQELTDDESPLWEQTVGNFVSSSSQYLSVPTASAVQVGTSNFMPGIGFNTTTTGALQIMYSYGSHATGKGYWECRIDAANTLTFEIWDGTTTNTITDTIPNRWQDGRWHIPAALIDKTNSKIFFWCDGVYIGSVAITATNTLTVSGENFYIGARKNSSSAIDSFFNGKLALFKLINNAADYNVTLVWNMGTREAVSSGTYTAPTTDSSKRLNNKFGTPNTNSAYFYTGLWIEDGEYEIQVCYEKGSANGMLDVVIDGNSVISQLDTYNGSTTHNNVTKYYGIKISSGLHSIKILNNSKNASSSGYTVNLQWVNFIKRRGHELGGVDNFFLLGDEISERQVLANGISIAATTTCYYNNEQDTNATGNNGDYTEGTLFLKGGYYRIDFVYSTFSSAAKLDLWFGNTQAVNAVDTYSASLVRNVLTTVYVRIQQGRQDVRLLVNGKNASATDYRFSITSIRGVRISD